ncbi:hypothetical protein [Chachezhania antarctica]|uniref:hypothetical protein n=1 Tax=Chachezhania antarctica TaxID=2340860 RepID=UPI000EB31408|nr:hypothetical protein [Chachezhania antarctica]|tara:strand:- start:27 stop:365 length:339 start_codon:yes stop_codon:yes gene_type:complete
MSGFLTEDDVLERVAPLTRVQLATFVEAEVVTPMESPDGPVFRRMDVVRMELLCELTETYALEPDALGVVMGLVDQLHGVRAELRAVLEALEAESDETRLRVVEVLKVSRAG